MRRPLNMVLGWMFTLSLVLAGACHDHKHDPITARDYYALYGVFDSTRFSFPGCEPKQQPRDLVPISSSDQQKKFAAWEKRGAEIEAEFLSVKSGSEAKARSLKELAAKCFRVLTTGDVPDAGSVHVTPEQIEIDVKRGEALQLAILPLADIYPKLLMDFLFIKEAAFGLAICIFMIFQPNGLAYRWWQMKNYFNLWPFSY